MANASTYRISMEVLAKSEPRIIVNLLLPRYSSDNADVLLNTPLPSKTISFPARFLQDIL